METIMVYEVNGKRFDDPQEALAYEKLCKEVELIMSRLAERTEEIERGLAYNKHNVETLKQCLKDFCEVCAKTIPSFEEWFIQVGNGERHPSHIGRILSDYSHRYPILQTNFYRFDSSCFENGYEFQQPYYVTHQEEFFEDMKKRLEYENNGN